MSDVDDTTAGTSGTVVNRRALLRASGVAAGIAGIGGIAAASGPPAGAAAGDPVLMGAANNAGTASTAVTTTADGPALILANSGGVPLRLQEHTPVDRSLVRSGDLWNGGHGNLEIAHGDGESSTVLTSYNYLTRVRELIPVKPTRGVDTRHGARIIVNPTGNLDSAGRLIGGHTIDLDFGNYMVFHGTAVLANLTVTQPAADGYLTMWQQGPRPGTSTLNYKAGQTVANFCLSGLYNDKVRLYASCTTHVVLDVVAFVVNSSSDINDDLLQYPPEFSGQAEGKPPAWWTAKNG